MPDNFAAIEVLVVELAKVGTLIDVVSKHTFKFDINAFNIKTSGMFFCVGCSSLQPKR